MTFARRALIVVWKDLLVERRSKETLNALVFFALLLLFAPFEFLLCLLHLSLSRHACPLSTDGSTLVDGGPSNNAAGGLI